MHTILVNFSLLLIYTMHAVESNLVALDFSLSLYAELSVGRSVHQAFSSKEKVKQ